MELCRPVGALIRTPVVGAAIPGEVDGRRFAVHIEEITNPSQTPSPPRKQCNPRLNQDMAYQANTPSPPLTRPTPALVVTFWGHPLP